jgi:hypothetical protein
MANFEVGGTLICSRNVKDSGGNYIDPSTSMKIQVDRLMPGIQIIIPSVDMVKDSTGHYHYDLQTASLATGSYRIAYIATDGTRITQYVDTFTLI